MNPFIYLRALRHVDYSVFCVSNRQKTYYDPVFGKSVPYSSGQQVKRSILNAITDNLGEQPSPVEFVFDIKGKTLGEGEVLSICDPSYSDQLLGGWMHSVKGGKEKTLKRRSPLSISAMRPLHPLLADSPKETATFDRSDRPHIHKVTVRDEKGNALTDEQIEAYMDENDVDRSFYRKFIKETERATGLFIYDVAIDLRRLFAVLAVSTNQIEPELKNETIKRLKDKGWIKSENVFGPCLVMPKADRDRIIPALADALLNWRITSNQSRTFSLMETLAVAISDNANTLATAIRAKLIDDGETPKAKPIVDAETGADLFVTLPCAGYIETETESSTALGEAKQKLIKLMNAFDYEHQMQTSLF